MGIAADTDTARRRERGYREAMVRAGLDVRESWLGFGTPTIAGGRHATRSLLERASADRPTGLFTASLLGAIGVLAELRDAGMVVPSDMSVIAFNDHELAEHLDPPLTTVRMPNFRMGEEAVRLLLEAIDGGVPRAGDCRPLGPTASARCVEFALPGTVTVLSPLKDPRDPCTPLNRRQPTD